VAKVYIIQPPGYWLFNRVAGLFSDPVLAILVMNISFSVAGVVVFYYTALFFGGRRKAFLAALAYSCIFYLWFSGEVHSTYASQALFPVAVFCVLLDYEREKASWKLGLAGLLFAMGAGLRPSDGVFLAPMLLYYSLTRLPKLKAVVFLTGIFLLCLCWVIPTLAAYAHVPGGIRGVLFYARDITTQKSVASGISLWLANVMRFVVPVLVAFWPVLVAAVLNATRNWQDWRIRMLLVWIVPGTLFFTLSYISDAPYLNFLSAAILLLAIGAPRMMAVTALWNAIFFLGFSPIPSRRLPVNVWNCFAGHFTSYGIEHQWWPNLSTLQGTRSIDPDRE
jgi:4-amino-4-deoxy-L-arabinose transferase-like glycosyltransferase